MGTNKTTLTLGTALREARIAAGFTTQQAAAKETPFREKDLSRWESGSAIPRGDTLVALARLYAPHLDLSRVTITWDVGYSARPSYRSGKRKRLVGPQQMPTLAVASSA